MGEKVRKSNKTDNDWF